MSNSHSTLLKPVNTCCLSESSAAASCHAARLLLARFGGFWFKNTSLSKTSLEKCHKPNRLPAVTSFPHLGAEATLLTGSVATTSSSLALTEAAKAEQRADRCSGKT